MSGNVQGVRYRDYIAEVARKFSLTGHVENMPDGTVEIILEGDARNLEKFEDFMGKDKKIGEASSDLCLATAIDYNIFQEQATQKFRTFSIVYSDSVQEELNEQFAAAMAVQVKMISSQDKMLEKQDRMLDNQDKTLISQGKLISEMNNNFQRLDDKYHKISENLDSLPERIAKEIAKAIK